MISQPHFQYFSKDTYFSGEIHFLTVFDLESTLFCGQAFRWQRFQTESEPIYACILDEAVVWVQELSPKRIRYASTKETLYQLPCHQFLEHYFGKNDDLLSMLPLEFGCKYPDLVPIFKDYNGLHILRQPLFETLISFMCAQGVGIMLIRRQVARLAELSGASIEDGLYQSHRFPTPAELASQSLQKVTFCTNNNKIRARHILAVATAVAEGRLNLDKYQHLKDASFSFKKENYLEFREELLSFGGIGEKIADCVCLFGFGAWHSFPIDTHVRQFMIKWFGIRMKGKSISAKNYAKIQKKAWKEMGDHAGYISQILFHYWRIKVRGLGVE